MIKFLETFKADSNNIDKEEIENLIKHCNYAYITDQETYQIEINFMVPFPIKYYSGSKQCILSGTTYETIDINSNSKVDDILEKIDKYRDYYYELLDAPIPV